MSTINFDPDLLTPLPKATKSIYCRIQFKKTLAENVRSFETMKEVEKKKLDEERKWVRREKILLDKTMKEKKNNFERRTQEEVDELQNKVRLESFANIK